MKYNVVRKDYLHELTLEVNNLISKGWEPQGGICVDSYTVGFEKKTCYYQAMIKRE